VKLLSLKASLEKNCMFLEYVFLLKN
jgi:hypothetical protein